MTLIDLMLTFDHPLIQVELELAINVLILAKLLDFAKDLEPDFFGTKAFLARLSCFNDFVDSLLGAFNGSLMLLVI